MNRRHSSRLLAPLLWMIMAGAGLATIALVVVGWRAVVSTPIDQSPADMPGALSSDRLILLPCEVGQGVYLIGNTSPAAVYVVQTADGLAMIDCGLEAEYDKVADALSQLRLDIKQLKVILLTHVHGDHTMGAERLREETGAKVYIGRDDAGPLRQGGPWEAIFSKFEMPGVSLHPTHVDGEVDDGQVIRLGDATFTAIATPGHTRGSFCYLLEHRGERALFTGDTVMSLSDGLGTYSTYLPPKYRGNVDDYLQSLKKLRQLPKPDLVLPGHPQSDPTPQDPRLTAQQWEDLLDRGIEELTQLAERYERDGADFLDGTPKEIAAGLFYLGELDGRAVYALLAGTNALLFDAARGPTAPEFVAAAWKELSIEPPATAAVLLTSCQGANVSGLQALVEATDCRVVVSPDGVAAAREQLHDAASVLPTDELASLAELPSIDTLLLPGRDKTAVGYYLRVGDAQILISGEVPIEGDELEMARVYEALAHEEWDAKVFSASLDKLEKLEPTVWLSARPLHGRNANLYGDDWLRALSTNKELVRHYWLTHGAAP